MPSRSKGGTRTVSPVPAWSAPAHDSALSEGVMSRIIHSFHARLPPKLWAKKRRNLAGIAKCRRFETELDPMFWRSDMGTVLLQLAVQGGLSDTKQPGREQFVSIESLDRPEYRLLLQFSDRHHIGRGGVIGAGIALRILHDGRQIILMQQWAGTHGASALNAVFQLAHVAGPVELHQCTQTFVA